MTAQQSADIAVPAHIPAERVWNNTLESYAREMEDPYLAISRLHDESPDIIWLPHGFRGAPAWVLTRHALIREAFLNPELFSSSKNADVAELLGVSWKLNPLEFDPPEHHMYRHLLQPSFSPTEVEKLSSMVGAVCNQLVSKFEAAGCCEFIAEFATPFPSQIFLSLMGLPVENLEQFVAWENAFFRGENITLRVQAARAILDYLDKFLADRKKNPQDDLASQIIMSEIQGRPINDDEVMGIVYNFYLGGLDTVLSTSGWIMQHLAKDQVLQNRLRENPSDIAQAVEELLRAYGVTQTRRVATQDFEFHGVEIRRGEQIMLPTFLAGRDPKAYDNPHTVDIDRKARHLTFAVGTHNCLGIHLARRELRLVIETFLSKFKNIRIPEGERIRYHTEAGKLFAASLGLAFYSLRKSITTNF